MTHIKQHHADMSMGGVMSEPARASENARVYLSHVTRCAGYVNSSMALPLSQVVGRPVQVHMPANYDPMVQEVFAFTAVPSVAPCQRPINSAWQLCAREYRTGQVPLPALLTSGDLNHFVAVTTPADAPHLCGPTAGPTKTLTHSAAQWQAPPPQVLGQPLQQGPSAAAAIAPPARPGGAAQRRLEHVGPAVSQHPLRGAKLRAKAVATGPGRALESRATGALPAPEPERAP
jgi:hypothetical protein